jgi:hypothetical protein
MQSSSLILHCGACRVSRDQLNHVEAPPATDTWFPLKHATVLDRVQETLQQSGFEVRSTQLALSRGNHRFFGTLDLTTPLASGVTLAVGVRNSTDKSLPIGFCAGERVFCCDNLAFRSEIMVTRKHTRFGEDRFREAISKAVQSLHQFREAEVARIQRWRRLFLTDTQAEAAILRGFEHKIVSPRLLPQVIRQWREPSFQEFQPRTLWSLENAFTTVLADVARANPQRFCALTIALHALLGTSDGAPAETITVPAEAPLAQAV